MSTTETTTQRAYSSGVTLSLGLISASFDLVPARRPNLGKETALSFICPDSHETPQRVGIRYVCPDGHTHQEHELQRAHIGTTDDGEKIVPLAPEDIVAVRCGDAPEKNLELAVHPAEQLDRLTTFDEAIYRVRPPAKSGSKQRELYALLVALAEDSKYALVGRLRIRDGVKLYRMRNLRGQLTLHSLIPAEDFAPVDDIDAPTISKTLLAEGRRLMVSMVADFEPAAYRHDGAALLAEIVAKREAEPVPVASAPTVADNDLLAALEASLAKSKTVKPRKGRTNKAPAPAKRVARVKKAS